MGSGLTIAYITFRKNPRFEWFAATLTREFRSCPDFDRGNCQVLVVDGRLWGEADTRRQEFASIVDGRFAFEHHPPKPSVWQGPHRLTSKDYFAAADTRNTVFALARGKHVAFVDDLSVLLPGWLKSHVHAMTNGYVLAGTTCKYETVSVDANGNCEFSNPSKSRAFNAGIDSRIQFLPSPTDLYLCRDSWLYGGTFSVPLEAAMGVNGQDEINDIIGGEDYDFGLRLSRTGIRMHITRQCGTVEDENAHGADVPMVRLDKPWPGHDGPYSSNKLFNRLLREDAARTWTIGNEFVLREVRDRVLAGNPFPVPTEPSRHWVDGQPLSEM
jgi:hypothetical protein